MATCLCCLGGLMAIASCAQQEDARTGQPPADDAVVEAAPPRVELLEEELRGENKEAAKPTESFPAADFEGTWISEQITYRTDGNNFHSVQNIRLVVTPAPPDDSGLVLIHLPDTVLTHRVTIFGRSEDETEWTQLRLTEPGWIKMRKGTPVFCFGPIGDHLEFVARKHGKQLQLKGDVFDGVFRRIE